MAGESKTAIVTGASQGIGAAIVTALLGAGYKVVANSRKITSSGAFATSENIALVDGNIGEAATAARVAETAIDRFGSIDVLVNNAGIFFTKAFTDYTADDFKALTSTNLEGFLYVTQLAIKQMLAQESGGSIVTVTASLVDNPIAGVNAAVPMITKGGLNAVTRSLAMEYAKHGIRVNAVAPGVVDTPLHRENPQEFLKTLSPMGRIADAKDIADAVLYLAGASQVTGEVLHVDGGAHFGKW
jgi:NAD(P)-dependent dehydrogenase (short-subunit alcohol dehydrogenase family)